MDELDLVRQDIKEIKEIDQKNFEKITKIEARQEIDAKDIERIKEDIKELKDSKKTEDENKKLNKKATWDNVIWRIIVPIALPFLATILMNFHQLLKILGGK